MNSLRSDVAELVKSLEVLLIGFQSLATLATDNRSKRPRRTLVLSLVLCLSGCWDSVDSLPQPPPVEITQSNAESVQPPSPALASHLSPAITAFLEKFDALSAKGFVPTLRSG